MTKEKLMELILQCIPYPNQVKNIDLTTSETAIRFEWRGEIYRISLNKSVEVVEKGMLIGSNSAILLQHLINR